MKPTILIVDDEASIRAALEKFLSGQGYSVLATANPHEAVKLAEGNVIDLALIDLVMPEMNGLEFLKKLRTISPSTMAIIITAYGTITSAVEAMKMGAYHYLTKPFELDDVASLVATAIDHKRLREENYFLQQQLKSKYKFENMIGSSEQIIGIFSLIRRVADTESTILILGESGTGKELVARAIHYNSRRAEKPFVIVNCAAIPEELLESELFGHVKGSFTGAYVTKAGKFDVADGGSVFLDEIGDMSPKLQVKLLRVLQERRFDPVGGTTSREVDVRIIAATNQDLEKAVRAKRFREDLYYRLNVIPIKIPPLRERRLDIPLMVDHFLRRFNKENERSVEGFTRDAMEILMKYDWPGNVRELENFVEQLVVLKGNGVIGIEDLADRLKGVKAKWGLSMVDLPERGIKFKKAVEDFEKALIVKALEKAKWNKNKAAVLLGLNRTTLVEKMKRKQLCTSP